MKEIGAGEAARRNENLVREERRKEEGRFKSEAPNEGTPWIGSGS